MGALWTVFKVVGSIALYGRLRPPKGKGEVNLFVTDFRPRYRNLALKIRPGGFAVLAQRGSGLYFDFGDDPINSGGKQPKKRLWTVFGVFRSLLINGLPQSAPKFNTRPLRSPPRPLRSPLEWRGEVVAKMAAEETGLDLGDPMTNSGDDQSNDKGQAAPGSSGRRL